MLYTFATVLPLLFIYHKIQHAVPHKEARRAEACCTAIYYIVFVSSTIVQLLEAAC